MSWPRKSTFPESGGISPAHAFRRVLFPQPDGPMMTVLLPSVKTDGDTPQRLVVGQGEPHVAEADDVLPAGGVGIIHVAAPQR